MKKINLVFGILLLCAVAAGVLHTGIAYLIARTQNAVTSFPPESVFFFIGIWYLVAVTLILSVWLIVRLVKGMPPKNAKGEPSGETKDNAR